MNFEQNVGGQLARLERALKLGEKVDALAWYEWAENVIDEGDIRFVNWALRVSELIVEAMSQDEYRQWGVKHGWVDDDGAWHAPHPREGR